MIKLPLSLAFAAQLSFFLVTALKIYGLASLAEALSRCGSLLLLCAFALIFVGGFVLFARRTLRLLCGYFSDTARSHRKLLYYCAQWQQQQSLFASKKAKLNYQYRQKISDLHKKAN